MISGFACVLLPFLGGCSQFVSNVPQIAQVAQHRASYTGKTITVTGRVHKLDQWDSRTGVPEQLFALCSGECVRVFMRMHSPIHNGELVTVTGPYYEVFHAGRDAYYNEIEGTEVLPRE